jgi:hypothetical protein
MTLTRAFYHNPFPGRSSPKINEIVRGGESSTIFGRNIVDIECLIRSAQAHHTAICTYTDNMHTRYNGNVGRSMDDQTWGAMSQDETTEFSRLLQLAEKDIFQISKSSEKKEEFDILQYIAHVSRSPMDIEWSRIDKSPSMNLRIEYWMAHMSIRYIAFILNVHHRNHKYEWSVETEMSGEIEQGYSPTLMESMQMAQWAAAEAYDAL